MTKEALSNLPFEPVRSSSPRDLPEDARGKSPDKTQWAEGDKETTTPHLGQIVRCKCYGWEFYCIR